MTGAAVGLMLGAGVVLCLVARWNRRPSLMARVAPYVGVDLPHTRRRTVDTWLRLAAVRLGTVVGGADSVRVRLDRLSTSLTVETFRIRQLKWGGVGLAAAMVMALAIWAHTHRSSATLLVLTAVGFMFGVMAADQQLTATVRRREQRIAAELPVVCDLLALAVAAGESPTRGLQRVQSVAHGPLSEEIGRVLADVRTGVPVGAALDGLAARTGVGALARFCDGLAVALERGTPLVGVLHAQAADARESARRDLIESGGRREILMMVPVVFGLLPTTIVFAFYPGLVGLRLTTGI